MHLDELAAVSCVHVVAKTHLDLGFTALASEVLDQYLTEFFPGPWTWRPSFAGPAARPDDHRRGLGCPGRPALLEFTNELPDMSGGLHVLLHDNVWGTNFRFTLDTSPGQP